jgi:homoserine kinase
VLPPSPGLLVAPLVVHESLAFVFAVPDFTVETKRARAVLPASVAHAQAAQAAAKSAALVHGLAHADARLLAAGCDDVLHVPFRRSLVPGYDAVTAAARAAGAFGATLSGSGPTVLAIAPLGRAAAVGDAMVRAWQACGVVAASFHAARPAGGLEMD